MCVCPAAIGMGLRDCVSFVCASLSNCEVSSTTEAKTRSSYARVLTEVVEPRWERILVQFKLADMPGVRGEVQLKIMDTLSRDYGSGKPCVVAWTVGS